ncbi:MAG: excinuclease ABC subunit UvrB [Actinobacteria bacterium HGW-Actinobacteria-1]|nr:MAG: excinuclease ABC subunit UvrB [Actinobacteria bacterium HGW-Actinobacteria-1]
MRSCIRTRLPASREGSGMTELKVVSGYEPAGDQPKAIEKLAEGIRAGMSDQTLLGVTGSGKTFTVAKLAEAVGKPTLILAPNKTLAAQLASEMRDIMPDNAVVYFVSYYDYYQPEAYVPSSDTYIEKDASINEEVEKLRHAATAALLSRRDVVVVASVSCIYGIGSPEDYAGMAVFLGVGADYDRDKLIRDLIEVNYDRNDYDLTRGTFRVRGDVVDIFPPYADNPVRVELFGDTIEALTEVDMVTGEVVSPFDSLPIWPATHYVTHPDRISEALDGIRDELQQRLAQLKSEGKLLEAQRLEMRTSYDLEMLETMGYCNGVENYSRHLDGRKPGEPPHTLIDYFGKDFLCVIDESHVTVPQLHGMYEGDRSRKLTLVEHGFRLPSALDNRPLRFEEFRARIPQTVFVSATPGEYEIRSSQQVVEQIIRPTGLVDPKVEVRPTLGQIDDLIAEVRERADRDERSLITTLTKKMAEDLTEYLFEHGIKVRYLHSDIGTLERVEILRDLRAGIVDAVVGINLLREGLDLPEVSLVAILDADKEGFLRNHRSLIQTIGRAARNVSGEVILYADKVTDSMRTAIDETDRRRAIQTAYNTEHGIEPKTIRKVIHDIAQYVRETEVGLEPSVSVAEELGKLPHAELARIIATMEEDMHGAAEALDFETAARLRDQVVKIKAEVESSTADEVLARLKQGARKGSAHGVRKRKR